MPQAKKHPQPKRGIQGLPDRLRLIVDKTHEGKVSAFARALGVQTSQVSYWLAGNNSPGSAHLRRIGLLTGYSIDWILGFKGPQKRDEREEIGDFARHLTDALFNSDSTPGVEWPGIDSDWTERLDDEHSTTPMESGAELAKAVSDSYWLVRRQRSGDKWAPSFHALASLMRKDAEKALQREWWNLAGELQHHSRTVAGYAYLLESKTVDWQDILDLAPAPLEFWYTPSATAPRPLPRYWTTFGVGGGARGAGFAALYAGLATVWWVDHMTGEARADSARDGFFTGNNPMLWGQEGETHWTKIDIHSYRPPGLESTPPPRSA